MSSNCSINCCSSPEITSSNVSVSNVNGVVSNEAVGSRVRTTVPETKKDNKYWERRRRNNEAARRSREKRRQNDMVMDKRILELSQRNKQLEHELFQLKINFGLVNTNPNKLDLEDTNIEHISPVTLNDEAVNNSNNSIDHINGMVFPVFTAFSPGSESLELTGKSNTDSLNKSNSCNQNDSSKPSMNSHKYQSNLINLNNIPFLSNIISTSNLEISPKPTLLLPTLLPKPSTKSQEIVPNSGVFSNGNVSSIEGLTFNTSSDVCNDSDKISGGVDSSQTLLGGKCLKMDIHDILDLSLKSINKDCFCVNNEIPLNSVSGNFESKEKFDNDNKDDIFHRIPENQSIDESMINSFLTGAVSTSTKDQLTDYVNHNSLFVTNFSNRVNINKKIRQFRLFEGNNLKKPPINSIRHHLSLKTRLNIRREVSAIVINENRKLRQDIDSLSSEIKMLKSIMLECTKPTVSNSFASRNS